MTVTKLSPLKNNGSWRCCCFFRVLRDICKCSSLIDTASTRSTWNMHIHFLREHFKFCNHLQKQIRYVEFSVWSTWSVGIGSDYLCNTPTRNINSIILHWFLFIVVFWVCSFSLWFTSLLIILFSLDDSLVIGFSFIYIFCFVLLSLVQLLIYNRLANHQWDFCAQAFLSIYYT